MKKFIYMIICILVVLLIIIILIYSFTAKRKQTAKEMIFEDKIKHIIAVTNYDDLKCYITDRWNSEQGIKEISHSKEFFELFSSAIKKYADDLSQDVLITLENRYEISIVENKRKMRFMYTNDPSGYGVVEYFIGENYNVYGVITINKSGALSIQSLIDKYCEIK